MRMTHGWAGPRMAVVALALTWLFAPSAESSPTSATDAPISLVDYSTSGTIDSTGVTGPNIISFNSVAGGSFQSPSSFSLGEFLIGALPANVTTSYTNTPFHITYVVQNVNGVAPSPNQTPLTVSGKLNGTVTGATQTGVVASFDPLPTSPLFQAGDFQNTLSVGGSTLLVPSSNNGGRTTLQGQITSVYNPQQVPEPATVAVFAAAALGLTLRRRLRNRLAA